MINDYLEIENAEGMPNLADGTFALNFLLAVKNGIITYASALTEATHPEVRTAFTNQLRDALALHTEISNLMITKGWLHPYHVREQFELDMKSSQMALMVAGLELFPGDTSRAGSFATPYK